MTTGRINQITIPLLFEHFDAISDTKVSKQLYCFYCAALLLNTLALLYPPWLQPLVAT